MADYNSTDQFLHLLSQVLGKIGRSLVTSQADDSHTNLSFVIETKRIYTHWFATPKGKCIAFIDLEKQALRLQSEITLSPIPWAGKTIFEIEQALTTQLNRLGIINDSVFTPMHYNIPDYNISKTLEPLNTNNVQVWCALRAMANQASITLAKTHQIDVEPRIWPHHFDTGIYIHATPAMGIGFGLAMQDTMVGSPYFYVAGYALSGQPINYSQKPDLDHGQWIITPNWQGAVLKVNSTVSLNAVNTFCKQAVNWLLV